MDPIVYEKVDRRELGLRGEVELSKKVFRKIPKVRVACVGDSTTYGYGIENLPTDAYPHQLEKLLGPSYSVQNFGKNAATLLKKGDLPYWEQIEYKQALKSKPDIVIINLGVNDAKP